jgi:Protein of unknown function (DUF3027)
VVATIPARAAKIDAVLGAAVDIARAAARAVGGDAVGEHRGVHAEDYRVVTHAFAATLPGYRGWYWAVSVARAPRNSHVTVDDVVLLPGEGALLAPPWVPWSERVEPGDLAPGDLVPPVADDVRLVPAYVLSDDPQVADVAFELGLGRVHVLSRDGRTEAAGRWHDSDYGPNSPMARQAPAQCGTCGFLVPVAGALRAAFGVCANEISPADGRVVNVEYGCGAHSEASVAVPALADRVGDVYDDGELVE